jgi:hypothetical protein
MSNRSLDDFLGGDDATDRDDAAEREDATATDPSNGDVPADSHDPERDGTDPDESEDRESERVDPVTVDPAAATATWHRAGADCESCGEAATRRWRQDDALVCADCKSW